MPRLPKLPAANPPAPVGDLITIAAAATHPETVDLVAALSAAGHPAVAEQLVDRIGSYSAFHITLLAWMSWCCPDAEQAKVWATRARVQWQAFVEKSGDELPNHFGISGFSAMALLDEDPIDSLEKARSFAGGANLPIVRTLLARGRLELALDLLEDSGRAVREGVGWSTTVLSRHEDGFMSALLHRLVAETRWDLLGRFTGMLVEHDGVFLGTICLSAALAGREDAAEALAAVPEPFLRGCFLSVLARMPAEARPSMAALMPGLPPHRGAIAQILLGDPDRAEAMLGEDDRHGRHWDPIIVAMLRNDVDGFESRLTPPVDAHTLRRAVVGGIRALSVQGDPEAMSAWAGRLDTAVAQIRRPENQPDVRAELGRALCEAGRRELGEPMLLAAFEQAHNLPRDDQGWARNNALEMVGCHAIRAQADSVALKVLQKCTSKYKRPNLAQRLAVRYVEAGDYAGAVRILSFIKPDQTHDGYAAILRSVEALIPGWTARFNHPPRVGGG